MQRKGHHELHCGFDMRAYLYQVLMTEDGTKYLFKEPGGHAELGDATSFITPMSTVYELDEYNIELPEPVYKPGDTVYWKGYLQKKPHVYVCHVVKAFYPMDLKMWFYMVSGLRDDLATFNYREIGTCVFSTYEEAEK